MVQVSDVPNWSEVLNIANTALLALVGFLLRDGWKAIHRRMDKIEEEHGDTRERVSSLEAQRGWNHPHRRRSDGSGPFPEES
jgi:hypothetical protein